MENKEKGLIVLSGITDSGKTTTLNLLIKYLKEQYPNSSIEELRQKRITDFNNLKDNHRVIFDNIGKKKLKIGIHTAGDDGKHVRSSIELFATCDIVVCPTKVSKQTGKDGSLQAMQKAIYEELENVKVIPIFKILNNFDRNDEDNQITLQILLDQLNRFI